jgi:uncharacterized repeat protein (TIGR03837 family)
MAGMRWDIFCRVIDNFGDIGVAWRLSAELARRGEAVRLWVDDPGALRWMVSALAADEQRCEDQAMSIAGVEVVTWTDPAPAWPPRDVVVETFGCEPPASFIERMAERLLAPAGLPPPVWINLEYLSAEPYVERSHGLRSPRASDPGRGLLKHFFYPGFTERTGGLIREAGLLQAQQAFDRDHWLAAQGLQVQPGERLVSLFCYGNRALPQLLARLAEAPTLLAVPPGPAAQAVREAMAAGNQVQPAGPGTMPTTSPTTSPTPLPTTAPAKLRVRFLPWLSQVDYDRLLWAADLNFVRGEDSFVRAQWAGRPFVWQIYPQDDGAHRRKLDAFLDLWLEGAPADLADRIRAWHLAWNGVAGYAHGVTADHQRSADPDTALPPWPDGARWAAQAVHWRSGLWKMPELVTGLIEFSAQSG